MKRILLILAAINILVLQKKLYPITSPSANVIALSDATVADTANSKALQYNVGGLGLLRYYEIEISHLPWIFNTSFEQINFVTPFPYGGIGVSVQFFHSFFDTENFNYTIGQKGEKLNNYDLTGRAGVGIKIFKNLGIGLGINYIRNAVLNISTDNINFSAGLLYRLRVFSKILHTAKRRVNKEDVAIGIAVNRIGAEDGLNIKVGTSMIPHPYFKLSFDGDYIVHKYYGNEFDLKTGVEFALRIKFTKFFLRAGYSLNNKNFNIGTGFQVNFGEKFYRLDYAQNIITPDEFQNNFSRRLGALSLTIGESELLLKLIKGKGFILSPDYFRLQDKIMIKKRIFKKIAETETEKFGVKILNIATTDKYLKAKKYDIKLNAMLAEQLKNKDKLKIEDKTPDLDIKVELIRDGELMRGVVKVLSEKRLLKQNIFEKSITFDREAIKNYDTVDILIKKVGEDIKIIPKKRGEEEDKDLKKVEEIAVEIAEWLNENIEEMLSGKYYITSDSSGVDIYVDGEYKGTIGEDKRYEISLLKGKHKLIFIRENSPAKEMEIITSPGVEREIKIKMRGGVFYVDLQINSFPEKMKVWIDGKEYGSTPLKAEKITSGEHTIMYENTSGNKWEERLIVNKEGIYKLYGVEQYEDNFVRINKEFWNVITREKGLKLQVGKKMLSIIGKSRDGVWNPNGLISREFKAGDLKLETEFKIDGNNYFTEIGLIDENGEGFGLGIDDKYFQYYETGKEPESYVPAIKLRSKKAKHKLEIKYSNSKVTITVDDLIIVEDKEKELAEKVRIMILADNTQPNSPTKFQVLSFLLKNEF